MRKNIIVFTDGACSNNGKKTAKGGIGIHFPNKEIDDVSSNIFSKIVITNQRAELLAIQKALNLIKELSDLNNYYQQVPPSVYQITIYSDSLYSIKSLTEWAIFWEKNNWLTKTKKPVKNLDLIKPIYEIMKNFKKVKFVHVRSHTKENTFEALGNAIADKLACSAIKI